MKTYKVSLAVDIGSTNLNINVQAESQEEAEEKGRDHVASLFAGMIYRSELANEGIELDQVLIDSSEETDEEPDLT